MPGIWQRDVDSEWVSRYLHLLGVPREPPGLDALSRLTRAHICTIPFENVTAILRRRAHPLGDVPAPDPNELLENWERGQGGGACFELAEMFRRLLVGLGYSAHAVLAQVTFPGSHQAVRVELGRRAYLIEVSNGAPFFEPIPLERPFEVHRLGLAYRFRPDQQTGRWVQERGIDGLWETFCSYDPVPADAGTLDRVYQRHHTPGASWVMEQLRLIRCREHEIYSLFNGRLTHYTAEGKWSEPLQDEASSPFVAGAFGMPGLPVAEALEALASRARGNERRR